MNRIVLHCLAGVAVVAFAGGGDWRQFRGTDNNSVSGEKSLPKTFSDQENIAWKAPLPGRGPSSPIVVDGRVIVTCSSGPRQDRLHVVALDAASGRLLWERQLWATGSTICHNFGAVACNTPASDGQRIVAFFSSNDLACFDLEGNLLWYRGLGYESPATRNDTAMASSPVIAEETVIVQLDNPGEAFVVGLDAATGETRWRMARDRDALWSSPTVLRGKTPAEDLVLLQSRTRLVAHEPRTGKEVAAYDHFCDTIASATTWEGIVYLPAGGMHALQLDRAGGTMKLLWQEQRLRGGNASPVACDGRVYALKSPAILVCGDAADGRVLWQLRLEGPVWATPVIVDGHAYVVSHPGLVQVVRLGEKGELVGTSRLDAGMLACPAVADGALFFRSDTQLWKVALPH